MATLTISLPQQTATLIDAARKKHGFSTRSEFLRALIRRYFSEDMEFQPFTPRPLGEIRLELAKTGKYSQEFIESVVKGLAKSSPYAR